MLFANNPISISTCRTVNPSGTSPFEDICLPRSPWTLCELLQGWFKADDVEFNGCR